MIGLRNAAFMLVFYAASALIVLSAPVSALFGQKQLTRHVRYWGKVHRWCARVLLGVRTRYDGAMPDGPYLYAAKHESMFETIELMLALDVPVVVMKAELMRVPVWGWTARRYGAIVVDREGSAATMRQMRREGEAAKAAGRPILLFPEGTRVAPGDAPPLKAGFAGLYRLLSLPVIPVAHDAGRVWPKGGLKRPGVITFRFGEVVPPGLKRDQAEARVHAAMNVFNPGLGDAASNLHSG